MGFLTFDVDREGRPSNLSERREWRTRVHAEGQVQVVVDGEDVVVSANGQVLGRARRDAGALVVVEAGYLDWARIERGLATAGASLAVRGKPDGARPTKRRGPTAPFALFVAALYAFLLAGFLVGLAAGGASPIDVFLQVAIVCVAPLVLVWGISILKGPARAERSGADWQGRPLAGPIARKGLALTVLGGLIYVYAAIGAGLTMFGRHSVAEPRSLAAAASTARDPHALARYAIAHRLVLDDFKRAETSLVRAFESGERGQRACATGTLAALEREQLDGHDVFVGALTTPEGPGLDLVAVGTSGTLARGSPATFCGVVFGTAGRKVVMVGMFDLPENVRPTVER